MSDIRLGTKSRKYTKIQRLRIWWHGVINAIREVPDTHYSEYIRLEEGDPGYEEAPFVLVESSHPLRFKFVDGKYERVKDVHL